MTGTEGVSLVRSRKERIVDSLQVLGKIQAKVTPIDERRL